MYCFGCIEIVDETFITYSKMCIGKISQEEIPKEFVQERN